MSENAVSLESLGFKPFRPEALIKKGKDATPLAALDMLKFVTKGSLPFGNDRVLYSCIAQVQKGNFRGAWNYLVKEPHNELLSPHINLPPHPDSSKYAPKVPVERAVPFTVIEESGAHISFTSNVPAEKLPDKYYVHPWEVTVPEMPGDSSLLAYAENVAAFLGEWSRVKAQIYDRANRTPLPRGVNFIATENDVKQVIGIAIQQGAQKLGKKLTSAEFADLYDLGGTNIEEAKANFKKPTIVKKNNN